MSQPTVSETALSENMLEGLRQSARDARTRFSIAPMATPDSIVATVNTLLRDLQKSGGSPPSDPYDDDPIYFGTLWCEQLVGTLAWQWLQLTFHDQDGSKAIGVVSPDRSMMICPFHFVFGCLVYGAPVTIEISYKFLKNLGSPGHQLKMLGDPPAPGAFLNVMDCVHHIIPPG